MIVVQRFAEVSCTAHMNMRLNRKLILAAIICLGFACLLLFISRIPQRDFVIKTYLYSGQSLRPGATVLIDGVEAGTVTAVNVRPELGQHPVEVFMSIKPHFRSSIPNDSVSSVVQQGILAPSSIEIDTRETLGTLIRDGGTLKSQDPAEDETAKTLEKFGNVVGDAIKAFPHSAAPKTNH